MKEFLGQLIYLGSYFEKKFSQLLFWPGSTKFNLKTNYFKCVKCYVCDKFVV